MEALLGVELFERCRRRVEVTPHGETLLNRAERVLSEARCLVELALGAAEPLESSLRLSAIQTLGPYYLPYLLRQARAAFPRLKLRLSEGQTEALLDSLRNGDTDMVLAAVPVAGDGLVIVPLFREPFVLVCPVGHALGVLEPISLHDLAADGLILLEEGHCLRDHALSLCAGTAPSARLATSVETLWHMIASGEGFSLLPALSLAGRGTIEDLVVCRDLPEPEAGRTIALIWRSTDPRRAALERLAALLRARPPQGVHGELQDARAHSS